MKKKLTNLITIGFMGVGKTSIGKYIQKISHFSTVDTDYVIEKKENMSINTIFKDKGEPYFREVESNICESLAKLDHCYISTGGGIIHTMKNCNRLKQSGIVCWINLDKKILLKRLKSCQSRPLLYEKSEEELTQLIEKRNKIYSKVADIIIDSDSHEICDIGQFLIKKYYEFLHEYKTNKR